MNKTRLATLIAGASLAAFAAGCTTDTTTNTNTTTTAPATNANTTGVATTNTNTGATNSTTTTTTTTTSRTANANITREDYDKDKDRFAKEAKDSGRKIGSGAEDAWLWTKTKASLAGADDLRDSTINVDVENSAVMLSGTVANPGQKTKAEMIAKGINGVKSVKNELKVSAADSMTNMNGNKNGNKNANR